MTRPAGTYAIFETSQGNIVIRLLEKEAPKTVENFVGLAEGTREFTNEKTGKKEKRAFYDGLIFHRVIPDFMSYFLPHFAPYRAKVSMMAASMIEPFSSKDSRHVRLRTPHW